MTSFESLGLPDELTRATEALGYKQPTPIQLSAVPVIAAGKDVAAEAQTGSGKTAAFALPILAQLAALQPRKSRQVFALTVVPTRELTLQVAAEFKALSRFMTTPPGVLAVIGGQPIEEQMAALRKEPAIVVATPGRLLDLLERKEIDLSELHTLVLDEADKLLDLGFSEELKQLLDQLPAERQTLLFSATLPPKVSALAQKVLLHPIEVRIDSDQVSPAEIRQRVFQVDRDKRRMLLQHLLTEGSWARTLVFVATQQGSEMLAGKLRRDGLPCSALHGGLEQDMRIEVLRRFKTRPTGVLIATDIAARGIDIPELSAVVNFDLPRSPHDYVHRIGRTGRAGETGIAISFIDHDSAAHFDLIEKRSEISLKREQVPGFELTGEAPQRKNDGAPVKGKRMSKKDKLRAEKAGRR